jgi:hypothetical protein
MRYPDSNRKESVRIALRRRFAPKATLDEEMKRDNWRMKADLWKSEDFLAGLLFILIPVLAAMLFVSSLGVGSSASRRWWS